MQEHRTIFQDLLTFRYRPSTVPHEFHHCGKQLGYGVSAARNTDSAVAPISPRKSRGRIVPPGGDAPAEESNNYPPQKVTEMSALLLLRRTNVTQREVGG